MKIKLEKMFRSELRNGLVDNFLSIVLQNYKVHIQPKILTVTY